MSKTYEQIAQELDSPLPRSAVKQREGGGRSSLSYLEGWWVIDRLNKTLGVGNWGYTHELKLVHSGADAYGKSTVHYLATVKLTVTMGTKDVDGFTRFADYEDVGYGDGSDKANIGKAHELAAKEAVTDGLKRCAKNLGMSMGLALYDKTQENVEDESPARKADSRAGSGSTGHVSGVVPKESGSGGAAMDAAARGAQGRAGGAGQGGPAPASRGTPDVGPKASVESGEADRQKMIKLVGSTAQVVLGQGKIQIADLFKLLGDRYNASKKEDLTLEQAKDFVEHLKEVANG